MSGKTRRRRLNKRAKRLGVSYEEVERVNNERRVTAQTEEAQKHAQRRFVGEVAYQARNGGKLIADGSGGSSVGPKALTEKKPTRVIVIKKKAE